MVVLFLLQPCSLLDHLKPIAAEERRVEEAERATREERERIYKRLSEGNTGLP